MMNVQRAMKKQKHQKMARQQIYGKNFPYNVPKSSKHDRHLPIRVLYIKKKYNPDPSATNLGVGVFTTPASGIQELELDTVPLFYWGIIRKEAKSFMSAVSILLVWMGRICPLKYPQEFIKMFVQFPTWLKCSIPIIMASFILAFPLCVKLSQYMYHLE